jgi:iron(III) transport system permease protein
LAADDRYCPIIRFLGDCRLTAGKARLRQSRGPCKAKHGTAKAFHALRLFQRNASMTGWRAIQAFSFVCVLLPLLAVGASAFAPAGEHWNYVSRHMLPTYLAETFFLTAGSCASTCMLGVALAWFVSMYQFAGKRVFEIALILPLAIPPYIAAYTYDGLTGYTGTIQAILRNHFAIHGGGLANIPAGIMAVWIFTVTLFPYVYLLTRTFLMHQSASIFENALLLGGGHLRMFAKVALPLLLPAAGAGTILVGLEVLNDFGVASFYGLNTFTTAIFSAWFGMGDSGTAVKLASILLALVFLLLFVRKSLHKARRYHIVSTKEKRVAARRVSRPAQAGIIIFCGLVCFFSFGLPLLQMLLWFGMTRENAFTPDMAKALAFTLRTAIPATLVIMVFATAASNAGRLSIGRFSAMLSQGTTLGYAIPSAVLAIGVISFFVRADSILRPVFPSAALQLSMSSVMLVFAYAVRFFTIGYQAVEAGFAKTGTLYTDASRTLGRGVTTTFFLVDLPLVRHALFSGSILIFIDVIKELPLSLLLRPFNTETLGTGVYRFANNEAMEETALPSLCIVLAGTFFILFMQFWEKRDTRRVCGH